MELDCESKLNIGRGVDFCHSIAVHAEFGHMPTAALAKQSRFERDADIVHAGIRPIANCAADQFPKFLVGLLGQNAGTGSALMQLAKLLCSRGEFSSPRFDLLAMADIVIDLKVL